MIDTAMEQIYTYKEENDDCQFTMQELRNVITTEKFVSKKVINICHSLGFCASYKEATLYEATATFATPPEIKPGNFAQFVHDNADLNISTMKCHDLHKSAEVFKNDNEDSRNNIFQAGVTCILGLYGASTKIKDLNTLRYNAFIKATGKNTSVLLSSLPPTTDAAFEPLKRVYLQIQIWLGNDVDRY
ncbi:uncharacterized protein TNCV_3152301 [Trichonephila clavipes]|nr:uncharacterized protein TNCV_3152301 [Trichonephila clavipes]